MYLFVTLWRETDISKKMFTLKGEYLQTFEQAFPDFKKRLKAGIQGCVVYFNKEKENNCYWADVKAVQVYSDSIVIYFNNFKKLDVLSGDIYVSLIRFGYRNGWINKKQGFLPLLCIVDNKEDFDEIRKNTFRVVKDKNILAHLRELSSRNDWKSICDLFEPLEKIHERDEWDNHEVLYEIRYACSKLAEPQRERAVDIITGLSHNLKQDGSIIIIENGSKQNCESFKRIRNALVNRGIYNIYSPCVSIWEPKTQYHCACFNMVRCFWDIPKIYEYLRMHGLRKAARYDVPFTYVVLRKDGSTKYKIEGNHNHYIELKDLRQYLDEQVNIKAIIRTVIEKGENIAISLCDGSLCVDSDKHAVWIKPVKKEQLRRQGIYMPIIAAEKITLRKVKVSSVNPGIVLEIQDNTEIEIDY